MRCIFLGVTVNEWFNKQKYLHFRDENGGYINPFNKGPWKNFFIFFFYYEKNLDKKFLPPTPDPVHAKLPPEMEKYAKKFADDQFFGGAPDHHA